MATAATGAVVMAGTEAGTGTGVAEAVAVVATEACVAVSDRNPARSSNDMPSA